MADLIKRAPMKRIVVTILLLRAACAAGAAETNVNAAAIYSPVFSNIAAWAGANTNIPLAGTNYSSPAADAAYKALRPQVDALAAAEAATFCDWGTKYEDGIAALLPYVSPARKAAQAAQWVAGYEAANGLPQWEAHAVEALRISRNVGEDRLLISLLVQIAGEKRALEFLADRIGKMDAGELAALDRKLAALPPGTTMIEAMQMEKALFVDQMIRQLLEAMRTADTNLFEQIFAGGTNAAAAAGSTGGAAEITRQHSWLSENLRLTSIVESAGKLKIGFETLDGDSFVLALGRPQRGIEMLSADFEREEAVIARSNETAIVRLKSRQIAPLVLRLRLPSREEARNQINAGGASAKNPAQLLMMAIAGDEGKDAEEFRKMTGGTAEGLMAVLRKTSDEYGEWIAAFQRLPLDGFRDWQEKFLKTATPLTKNLLPAADRVAEKEKDMFAAREKIAAAIAARRAVLAR